MKIIDSNDCNRVMDGSIRDDILCNKKTNETPSEHEEQRQLVSWFRKSYKDVLIFAIPNGGLRGQREAMRLKLEGVTPGIPDLYIPAWRLWIEMKRRKGGVLSKDQNEIITYLESIGDSVIVGKGWEDARSKVLDFLQET